MATTPIKAVLFDVGGIFVTQRLDARCFLDLLGLNPNDPFDAECVDKAIWSHRDQHDLGLADVEFWATVALDVGVEIPRAQQLRALIEADVSRMREAERSALAVADALQARGITLGILANAPTTVATEIRHAEWVQGRFTEFCFSSDYKVRKPHSSIYQAAIQNLNLPVGEILFIDDRAKHTRGAQYVGMDAIVWNDADQVMKELQERNVL